MAARRRNQGPPADKYKRNWRIGEVIRYNFLHGQDRAIFRRPEE